MSLLREKLLGSVEVTFVNFWFPFSTSLTAPFPKGPTSGRLGKSNLSWPLHLWKPFWKAKLRTVVVLQNVLMLSLLEEEEWSSWMWVFLEALRFLIVESRFRRLNHLNNEKRLFPRTKGLWRANTPEPISASTTEENSWRFPASAQTVFCTILTHAFSLSAPQMHLNST